VHFVAGGNFRLGVWQPVGNQLETRKFCSVQFGNFGNSEALFILTHSMSAKIVPIFGTERANRNLHKSLVA
jgi:hypothetical protein